MHAPPAFQVTVCRFGVWRVACGALAAASWWVTAHWALVAAQPYPLWLAVSLVLLVMASVGVLRQAWRLRPTSLRWDGQLWHVGPAATMGQEPQAGRLVVALDLGGWMLLRFMAEEGRRATWLPVQRQGHEPAWHGLRATVYCARPVSPPTAAPF